MQPAEPFVWVDGERLIRFGRGTAAEAREIARERGFDPYVLLTTERAQADAPGLADDAAAVLHVPPGQVPDVAAAVRDAVGGRPIVALGGGRVVDAAKAIAAADGLRCAAVPTTLSGAEVTRIHRLPAGVTGAELVRPALVVCDPALMASQPMPALAASAMNALAHGVEALYVPQRNPVAEIAALRGAELIAAALEPEDPDRDALALGALLCSWALGATGYAVHHVISQTLVRVAGTPHAETNAVVLPHAIGLMARRASREMGLLAVALGAARADPDHARERAALLARRAGVTGLTALGADPASFAEVVRQASRRAELANTPGPPGEEELAALLEAAS